ncbi:uncharacterized protein LOC128323620 isoform X2 [Hemicordylus capensis]|uniref:uncharacterized protein LOC128323620 isoform X2 n=1 Tax=Hemicordylus capensis TaxID=884348 RepID=UPI002302A15A|nr:uncharacterized protein LOC128323620 isoform X2 [Hemicordylus capensis]
MPHTKSHALKINGCAFKVPEPFRHCGLTLMVAKPKLPSCTVSVATGNQGTNSTVKVRNGPIIDEKACVNKSIQVSEENNFLENIKILQKENLQLKGTLEEKDSTISRLMKIIEDQATEYNTAVELEKEHWNKTERQLEESKHLVREKMQLLDETRTHYTKIIQEQATQHAELVFEMKKQIEAEIRCREEKIAKLKQYISCTFQEKSRNVNTANIGSYNWKIFEGLKITLQILYFVQKL